MVLELVLAQCGVGPVLTQLAEGLMVSQCLYWPLVRDWILMWLVVVVFVLCLLLRVFSIQQQIYYMKKNMSYV